jgi:hypothetical protein
LYVVYVPVVEKRDYCRKKKGEPENAERKFKAIYQQANHSKKWPMRIPIERDGKTITLNSNPACPQNDIGVTRLFC